MIAPKPKDWVMAIAPYVPGRSKSDSGAAAIKLSANESPLGTSPLAVAAFADHAGSLDRYPDPGAALLRETIAAKYGLEPERVIYGTGSDEILHMIAAVYAGPGDEIIHVRYGFAVYEIATRRVGALPVIARDKDYATDVDALLACMTSKTRVIYIANPNNPTGTFLARAELARLHANLPARVMLVIDQAYAEYVAAEDDDGALDLARTAPNVIITRTFSKIHGLAAERIGWGYGSAEAVMAMHRIRLPFCCTTAGQAAATAAISDDAFIEAARLHNARWRAWFAEEIGKLGNAGLRAVPSEANFLLVLFEGEVSAESAYHGLMERGYIVRWLPGQGLGNGLRITIGTEADMRGLTAELRDIVGAH